MKSKYSHFFQNLIGKEEIKKRKYRLEVSLNFEEESKVSLSKEVEGFSTDVSKISLSYLENLKESHPGFVDYDLKVFNKAGFLIGMEYSYQEKFRSSFRPS